EHVLEELRVAEHRRRGQGPLQQPAPGQEADRGDEEGGKPAVAHHRTSGRGSRVRGRATLPHPSHVSRLTSHFSLLTASSIAPHAASTTSSSGRLASRWTTPGPSTAR